MNFVINTNVVSPHTVPLTVALNALHCFESVSYVYTLNSAERFRTEGEYEKIKALAIDSTRDHKLSRRISLEADCLMENVRDFDVMEERTRQGKNTIYCSERWFKPIRLDSPRNAEYAAGAGLSISGFFKMIFPFAQKRAIRMVRLLKSGSLLYFPVGIEAARDMARMCGLLNGDLSCIFRAPQLGFENKPGGRIWSENGNDSQYCLGKMRMWGYFVSSKAKSREREPDHSIKRLKVLWVGRMFSWKRVDTVIRAVCGLPDVELNIFGTGPEESRLRRIAKAQTNVRFHGMVPIDEVREQMRQHDVYVLSSNAFEGWGAVVNEALEEGMKVVGTFEAGASATLLPKSNLFHAGDWKALRTILQKPIADVSVGEWSASSAARVLCNLTKEDRDVNE